MGHPQGIWRTQLPVTTRTPKEHPYPSVIHGFSPTGPKHAVQEQAKPWWDPAAIYSSVATALHALSPPPHNSPHSSGSGAEPIPTCISPPKALQSGTKHLCTPSHRSSSHPQGLVKQLTDIPCTANPAFQPCCPHSSPFPKFVKSMKTFPPTFGADPGVGNLLWILLCQLWTLPHVHKFIRISLPGPSEALKPLS